MPNAPEHKGGSVAWQWMVLRLVQKLNAPSSIVSREAGRVSSVNFVQLEKASRYISVTFSGILSVVKFLHPENVDELILPNFAGKVIFVKLIQFLKVEYHISIILSGIKIEVRL